MSVRALLWAASIAASACASAPPAPAPPPPPSFENKLASILRLEDRRILREQIQQAPAPVTPLPPPRRGVAVAAPEPPPPPDLTRLLNDTEARVRRRAALAIGRVGLVDGVPPLLPVLMDADPEVRQMAAFALGLIGDAAAVPALIELLADQSPLVKGSAAEALGLIGDARAAAPIGQMVKALVDGGVQSNDDGVIRDTPAAAFRLGLYALVRLKAYDPLAAAVLDPNGAPRVRSWPVAYAFQRLEDKRGLSALLALVQEQDQITKAFAVKGLGAMEDRRAGAAIVPLITSPEQPVAVEAIRAAARLREPLASAPILRLLQTPTANPTLRIEAAAAIGAVGGTGAADTLIDILGDRTPAVRVGTTASFARLDPEGFITVLSGLDADTHWSVRAALAGVLATLSREAAEARLKMMLNDADPKVVPAALDAIAKIKLADAGTLALDRLKVDDPVIRAAAARAVEALKPEGAIGALSDAYAKGQSDTTYVARAAALSAAAAYGAAAATPLLERGLADPEWAVRVRAATLLTTLNPQSDAAVRARPAPSLPPERYEAPRLVSPAVSTQAYIETDRGTIQIELAVLDAPQTVENFVILAKRGVFDGNVIHRVVPDFVIQAGDPRGDGEGGPGYSIRDELNQRPYVRGTVGMALDWEDTGGSQFFITLSPQPHLDARYTAFGRVISGMEIADQIQPWDVIRRVRIWDGTELSGP